MKEKMAEVQKNRALFEPIKIYVEKKTEAQTFFPVNFVKLTFHFEMPYMK